MISGFCYLHPNIVGKVIDFCNFLAKRYNLIFEGSSYFSDDTEYILSNVLITFSRCIGYKVYEIHNNVFDEINKETIKYNFKLEFNDLCNQICLSACNDILDKYLCNTNIADILCRITCYKLSGYTMSDGSKYIIPKLENVKVGDNIHIYNVARVGNKGSVFKSHYNIHIISNKCYDGIIPVSFLTEFCNKTEVTYEQYKTEKMQNNLKNLKLLKAIDKEIKIYVTVDELVDLIYEYM